MFIEVFDAARRDLPEFLCRVTKLLEANADWSLRSGVVNPDRDCSKVVCTNSAVDYEGDVRIDYRFDAVEQFTIGAREDAFEAAIWIGGVLRSPHHEPDCVLFDCHVLR